MTTPLTVYGNNAASGTLSTANQLESSSAGTTSASVNTLIGTVIGYGEIYAQGNAGTWPGLGLIGNPSGNGFLFDVATLEGQQIIAGNWTPALRTALSTGTATADMYVRAYKYNSGTYTLIGSMLKSSCALTTTITTYTFSATSLLGMAFATGDRLYLDHWLNITVAGGTGATYHLQECNQAGLGRPNNFQIATPGYVVAPVVSTSQLIRKHHVVGRIR